MNRPLEMLIIDDNKEYAESLYRKAQRFQILLEHKDNLEDAMLFLKSDKGRKISGVILDVVCMKSKDQEVPSRNFITAAIGFLTKEAPLLPIAVITGEPDQYTELSKLYEGTKNVYSKGPGPDEEKMLEFLKSEALKLNRVKIMNKHKDIFGIVEEFFNTETEEDLIDCLNNLNTSDKTQIKNNLACIRRLLEKICIELYKSKPDWVDSENIIEGNVKVKAIIKHLRQSGHVDQNTDYFTRAIYAVSSDYGAHDGTQNRKQKGSPVSKYTVHAAAYALLDLFLWFKKVVNQDA